MVSVFRLWPSGLQHCIVLQVDTDVCEEQRCQYPVQELLTQGPFIRQATGIDLQPNNMNRESRLSLKGWGGGEIPVTDCGGQYGCETLRLPQFLDNWLRDSSEVSLMCRPSFTPQEDYWYSFLLEDESTSGFLIHTLKEK
jgi:hypothetical protein